MASGVLHAMVIAAGLLITWSVIHEDTRSDPRPIVSDFRATAFLPVQSLPKTDAEIVEMSPEIDSVPTMPPPVLPRYIEPAWSSMDISDQDRALLGDGKATFAGARVTNARSLVYVIDASGSMTTWLPLVLKALEQSLDRLTSSQRFAVIFFQKDQSISVPPGGLVKANAANINRVMEWASRGANLIPGGGSNPLAAMEDAFSLRPDVIFLLSEGLDGIRGSNLDVDAMLERLDALNPIADPISSERWTRVQCIEIGAGSRNEEDEDIDSTMKLLGARYGGDDGWIRMDRESLVESPAGAP